MSNYHRDVGDIDVGNVPSLNTPVPTRREELPPKLTP